MFTHSPEGDSDLHIPGEGYAGCLEDTAPSLFCQPLPWASPRTRDTNFLNRTLGSAGEKIPEAPLNPEVLFSHLPHYISLDSRRGRDYAEEYHGAAETQPLRVPGAQDYSCVCGYTLWVDAWSNGFEPRTNVRIT